MFYVSFAQLSLSTAVSYNMCSVVPPVISEFQSRQTKRGIVALRFLHWCYRRLKCLGMLVLCWPVCTNVLKVHDAFMFRIKLLDHEDTDTMLLQNIKNHLLNGAQDPSVWYVNCHCV